MARSTNEGRQFLEKLHQLKAIALFNFRWPEIVVRTLFQAAGKVRRLSIQAFPGVVESDRTQPLMRTH